jgi:hypothetical protein
LEDCTLVAEKCGLDRKIKGAIALNDKFWAIIYTNDRQNHINRLGSNSFDYDIFDKTSNTIVRSGESLFIAGHGDRNIINISETKMKIMDEHFETFQEIPIKNYFKYELMNDKVMIVVENVKNMFRIKFLKLAKRKYACLFKIESTGIIYDLKKIDDQKFACLCERNLIIRNLERTVLKSFEIDKEYNSIIKLNKDRIILFSNSQNEFGIQMRHIESGHLKNVPYCDLVGTCSFGFLVRQRGDINPFILRAYDRDAMFIGVILTNKISSEPIKSVTQLNNEFYFVIVRSGYKIVKCNFQSFKILKKFNIYNFYSFFFII